jgi:hypothetical protein
MDGCRFCALAESYLASPPLANASEEGPRLHPGLEVLFPITPDRFRSLKPATKCHRPRNLRYSKGHCLAHSRGMLGIDSPPALNLGSARSREECPFETHRGALVLASLAICAVWRRRPEN